MPCVYTTTNRGGRWFHACQVHPGCVVASDDPAYPWDCPATGVYRGRPIARGGAASARSLPADAAGLPLAVGLLLSHARAMRAIGRLDAAGLANAERQALQCAHCAGLNDEGCCPDGERPVCRNRWYAVWIAGQCEHFTTADDERIDVVYPLGPGSRWDDNELRYSLRSLEANFPNLGRVWVIGHRPNWLTNVMHLRPEGIVPGGKDADMLNKMLVACRAGVSPRFVRMSDDQVLLRPIRFADMRPLYHEEITDQTEWNQSHKWWHRMQNTRDALKAAGVQAIYNYDTHSPAPCDRDKILSTIHAFDFRVPPGFCINTLVMNATGARGEPAAGKCCFARGGCNDAEQIDRDLDGKTYLGYNDGGLTPALKSMLARRFPTPSRFERTGAEPNRGIVTLAGGPVYTLNAYLNCRLIRHTGCTLPIQWFYLGREMSAAWLRTIRETIPNCETIDLGGGRTDNTKRRGGWQAKVEAILRSTFEELLFLDSDSFPQRDPAALFEQPLFQDHDCVFWPDLRRLNDRRRAWMRAKYGIEMPEWEIESGQMLIRKPAAVPALEVTREINSNSREVYRVLHGDKDTFAAGAVAAGVRYAIVPHSCHRDAAKNLVQYDSDGRAAISHLTKGKWRPETPGRVDRAYFGHYREALRIYRQVEAAGLFREENAMPAIRTRNEFCAVEARRIIDHDMYEILPLVGHRRPVQYIVDVGGNAGAFTISASAAFPNAEIIVVEPDPDLMTDIRLNTAECKAKIHYCEKACVGRPVDRVEFVRVLGHCHANHVASDRWHAEHAQTGSESTERITVAAATLPAILAECGFPRIDILKVDAEGVEGEVLENLRQAGWMDRIHWIRGEWHGRDDQPRIEAALKETHVLTFGRGPDNGYLIAHNRLDA